MTEPAPTPALVPDAPANPIVEEAEPPATPVRYVAADGCSLIYDYPVVHRTEAATARFTNGFDTLAQIEVKPDPTASGRMRLKFLWTRRDALGRRGPSKGMRAETNQPELVLTTDGSRWTEPVQWPPPARPADFDSVDRLYPALPGALAPGSESAWKPPPMGDDVSVDSVSLKLSRWIRIGGELACELEGGWSKEKSSDDKSGGQRTSRRRALRGAARFIVLASGRLLTSEIHQSLDTMVSVQDASAKETQEKVSSELRLVQACRGVSLPPLHPPPGPEERAILSYTRLRDAVGRGDHAAIGALLAPALVARTGKDAVVGALLDYLKRFGPTSLGFAGVPGVTPKAEDGRLSFTIGGSAPAGAGGKDSVHVDVRVVVEHKGEAFWIRSIQVSAPGEPDVFEISDARVFITRSSVLTAPLR